MIINRKFNTNGRCDECDVVTHFYTPTEVR